MEVLDAKKLRALEDENRRLKEIVADLSLDREVLKAVIPKTRMELVNARRTSLSRWRNIASASGRLAGLSKWTAPVTVMTSHSAGTSAPRHSARAPVSRIFVKQRGHHIIAEKILYGIVGRRSGKTFHVTSRLTAVVWNTPRELGHGRVEKGRAGKQWVLGFIDEYLPLLLGRWRQGIAILCETARAERNQHNEYNYHMPGAWTVKHKPQVVQVEYRSGTEEK